MCLLHVNITLYDKYFLYKLCHFNLNIGFENDAHYEIDKVADLKTNKAQNNGM